MTPLRNSLSGTEIEMMEVDQDDSQTRNKNLVTLAVKRGNETPEERKARRKIERKKRRRSSLGGGTFLSAVEQSWFNRIFDKEAAFIQGVQQALPEVRNPHLQDNEEEKMENFLMEDEGVQKTEGKRAKFLARLKLIQETKNKKMKTGEGSEEPVASRALTHEELKGRLHAKIDALAQKKNEKKRLRKQKKKELKKQQGEDTSDKKKKFISKANPNLKNQQKGERETVKDEKPVISSSNIDNNQPKTPLRKKPVVKSNGDIVYSKFDFISQDKHDDPLAKKGKPKPEDLLRRVQKTESKVKNLESRGKTSEAASIVETQKWDSALKRAQGEKIRDDAGLLKKTIKKQEKRKQVSKKKWQERTEKVDKEKEAKQDKRQANIQARKDERVKKTKKQQRKKGRLA